jgi:hypothetical protein
MSDSRMSTEALIVEPSQVVHETIDDEVIIIQLDRANYYSLAGTGLEIWRMICAGLSPDAILSRLQNAYRSDNGSIAADFEALLGQLREEHLVQDAPGDGAHPPPNDTPSLESSALAGSYVTPKLEKYTDMQDFLLVDPIHDVAPEGWPTLNHGE